MDLKTLRNYSVTLKHMFEDTSVGDTDVKDSSLLPNVDPKMLGELVCWAESFPSSNEERKEYNLKFVQAYANIPLIYNLLTVITCFSLMFFAGSEFLGYSAFIDRFDRFHRGNICKEQKFFRNSE